MWLHLSFDSIIIISWTNGITKIPRVTTTSNIKPIQTTIVLIVFCCWPPHAFEQNGSIHDTCIFLFFFCKFFFLPENEREFILNKKKLNVRQSYARNFKFTLYKMWQMHDLHQNEIRPNISICEPRNIDLVISL